MIHTKMKIDVKNFERRKRRERFMNGAKEKTDFALSAQVENANNANRKICPSTTLSLSTLA